MMSMQEALGRAAIEDAFARPQFDPNYAYRYEQHGKQRLVHVHGRNRDGVFCSGFWRTLSQQEMEAHWILCDRSGEPFDPSRPQGPTLREWMD